MEASEAEAQRQGAGQAEAVPTSSEALMGAVSLPPTVWGVLTARQAEWRSAEANTIVCCLS